MPTKKECSTAGSNLKVKKTSTAGRILQTCEPVKTKMLVKKYPKKVEPVKKKKLVKTYPKQAAAVSSFLGTIGAKTVSARTALTVREKPKEDASAVSQSNPYGLDREAMNKMSPEELFGSLPTLAKKVVLDPKITGIKVANPKRALLREVERVVRGMKAAAESIENIYKSKGKPIPNPIKKNYKQLFYYSLAGGNLNNMWEIMSRKTHFKYHPRKVAQVFKNDDNSIETAEKAIAALLFARSPDGDSSNPEYFKEGMDYLNRLLDYYKEDFVAKSQALLGKAKESSAKDKGEENEEAKKWVLERFPQFGKGWSYSQHDFYEGAHGVYQNPLKFIFVVKSITKTGASGIKLTPQGRVQDRMKEWIISPMSQSWSSLRGRDLEDRESKFIKNAIKMKKGRYPVEEIENAN